MVGGLRSGLLTEADHDHLEQPAGDAVALLPELEVRMHRRAAEDNHGVGLMRGEGIVRLVAIAARAGNNRLHARVDRHPDPLLGHPEEREDLPLSFGCSTAVAAHRRDHEGLATLGLDLGDDRLDRLERASRAATSHRNPYALAVADPLAELQRAQPIANRAGKIADPVMRKELAHFCHARQRMYLW